MSSRPRYRSIDELTPSQQRGWGGVLVALGVFLAWGIHAHPENLRAPAWVAYAACGVFVMTGLAIALRGWLSRRGYAWMMVAVVCVMTAIPAWISMGDGVRQCRSNMAFLRGEAGCRVGFGVSTVLMLGVCVISIRLALRTKPDESAG